MQCYFVAEQIGFALVVEQVAVVAAAVAVVFYLVTELTTCLLFHLFLPKRSK